LRNLHASHEQEMGHVERCLVPFYWLLPKCIALRLPTTHTHNGSACRVIALSPVHGGSREAVLGPPVYGEFGNARHGPSGRFTGLLAVRLQPVGAHRVGAKKTP
jgi:hypothetical protein